VCRKISGGPRAAREQPRAFGRLKDPSTHCCTHSENDGTQYEYNFDSPESMPFGSEPPSITGTLSTQERYRSGRLGSNPSYTRIVGPTVIVTTEEKRRAKIVFAPFMIHEALSSLTESAFDSHPCCVVSVTYVRTHCFHGGGNVDPLWGNSDYCDKPCTCVR
jgi:hypothetical protein